MEPRSKVPPRCASRLRPCRPRAEHAAWPLTSFSTTAPLDPASRPNPRLLSLGPASATISSKTATSSKPGRLSSTGALSSAPARLLRLACAARWSPPLKACASISSPRFALAHLPERGSRDHGEPATVPTTLPPRTGFERLFRSASPRGASPARVIELDRRECQRHHAEPDVSHRLLQSEQPTSTTTNHPNPGRDRRHDASSSRWTWRGPPNGVGAPSAVSTADSGWHRGFPRCPSLAARTTAFTRHQPRIHEPGALRQAGAASLPLLRTGFRRGAGFRRSQAFARRAREAGPHTLERAFPKLDPLEHPLSRPRSELGWRGRVRRSPPSRSRTTIKAIPPREPWPHDREPKLAMNEEPEFAGPRTICLRRSPATATRFHEGRR